MEKEQYQQGLVSIITPVYHAERFIEQTILSVQAQAYQDWEMILVDDCSNDRSGEIIKSFAVEDARIRYYRLEKNSGAAVARNTAIGYAKGEYLAFLDSDDLWLPEKLSQQLAFMKEKKCTFSFTRINFIDADNKIVKSKVPIPERIDYRHLLRQTVIATSTVLINRCAFPYFTMPLRRGGQDYATWLMLLRHTDYAYGLNECLTSYRISDHSLSSNKFSSIRQVYEIQTQDEKISKVKAVFNTFCFCVYAFKKHFF